MLSPASLRVCCLAVMAPALTKADRRAECLPVALSDPFCESKTVTPYNRKDKYIEAHFPKLSSKFACLLNNRRKAYIHKTWYRTHLKNNSPEFCFRSPPTDLHNGKLNAESQSEAWHGTSVTLAVADKVKLKYTMNKNSSSIKNMGLARTNASLSLHSMKKVNRITQFAPKDKGNPSTPDVGESSPDLPDSTNSELETGLTITRVIQTSTEQSPGEVTSSSGDAILCSVVEQLSSLEGDVTLPVACASPAAEAASENCSITMASLSNVNSVSVSKDLNLSVPVTLTGPEIVEDPSKSLVVTDAEHPEQLSSLQTDILPASCTADALLEATVSSSIKSSDITNNESSSTSKSEISSLQTSSTGPNLSNLSFESDDFLISNCPPQTMGVTKLSSTVSVEQLTVKESAKPRLQRNKVPKKKDCCPHSVDNQSLLNDKYSEGFKRILAAVEKTELLVRICISAYSKKEIGELVHSYQTKLGIPCQRQMKKNTRPVKDVVGLKAELLQSEDVKTLSTSALVNLVRKLESSGSPGNLLPQQNISLSGIDGSSGDAAVMAFAPEDIANVVHTSRELLTNIKKELRCVDPDLTESSDDGESDLDSQESESAHKMALWKFMKERAALTCRSTWLIARVHELENQLRTALGALQKVSSSVRDVCLEEEFSTSESATALSIAGSGDASSQAKQKVKGLTRPVNGYLDHSPINSIAHIGQNVCSVESLHLDEDHIKTDLFDAPQCSRTRALNVSAFQKRDVLVTTGLHLTNNKFSKLSNMGCHCSCQDEVLPCVLCMGRYQCVQSVDPDSMPLLDRVSLLDSNFHPLLSFQKDVPLILHFENILKKNESQYQVVRPVSPTPSYGSLDFGTKPRHFTDAQSRNRKLNSYARTLSEKYRNKHLRNTKHLRKHGLIFGKWKRYQNRSFHARDHFRRISIDSSGSSHDSPIPSPSSVFEDGFDNLRRRRDDNQYGINDVIIPYSNKSVRLVDFEFKDIVVPSFRIDDNRTENENPAVQDSSDTTTEIFPKDEETHEDVYLVRHDLLEIEEKKINKRPSVMNLGPNPKRPRREHRFDSRADSSGANTPDPVLFCDQDMFQDHSSMTAPTPPALSPPATPSSATFVSDDSQPSLGSALAIRFDRKKVAPIKRPSEESMVVRQYADSEEVLPYETRSFPLSTEQYEEIAADPYGEDTELTVSGPSSPASPGSTTQSTSTIEEDITDPEWMVLRNNPTQELPGLKLKLAKR